MMPYPVIKHAAKIAAHFNRAKNQYDDFSSLQKQTGRQLIRLITHQQQDFFNVMDLGCGTGFITGELARQINYKHFHAIDIAADLLNEAKKHLHDTDIQIDEENFDHLFYVDAYDLIFSNMALQWSSNLKDTLHNIALATKKHGMIAFSLPLPGTFAELQPLYAVNEFIAAEEIQKYFTHLNLGIVIQQTERITFQYQNTIEVLKTIKNCGANYAIKRQHKGLGGKRNIAKANLNQLTYQIAYFIARKNK